MARENSYSKIHATRAQRVSRAWIPYVDLSRSFPSRNRNKLLSKSSFFKRMLPPINLPTRIANDDASYKGNIRCHMLSLNWRVNRDSRTSRRIRPSILRWNVDLCESTAFQIIKIQTKLNPSDRCPVSSLKTKKGKKNNFPTSVCSSSVFNNHYYNFITF